MTNPIEFEKLRSRIAAAQHDLYTAVFNTQNLQLPVAPVAKPVQAGLLQ